jgi:hypothetical protein
LNNTRIIQEEEEKGTEEERKRGREKGTEYTG